MKKKTGFVSIVGAGPGDPGLLTLNAKKALSLCDVVIYDYLVHPKILDFAPDAELVYAGKKGGDRSSVSQQTIEQLLAKHAEAGKKVVRLKGGDPFIFGRGGEEALFLEKKHIPFEIIPGISAGVGASAYAGIPITHRMFASEVTFLTAHEDPTKNKSDINWKAVAGLRGTLVIYMGVSTFAGVIKTLIENGKSKKTPVSMIEWATTSKQKVVTGTLENILRVSKESNIQPPAITIIGDVNQLRRRLMWFEKKPLFGKTIVVTRSRKQASELSQKLITEGAEVIELPTISIEPIRNFRLLDKAISGIGGYDWLVFTSENGVEVFFKRLRILGYDTRCLHLLRIAAIGPGTNARLNHYGLQADLIPEVYSSQDLIKSFQMEEVAGKRFLLIRTNIAPDFLRETLIKRKALVTEVSAYRTEKPTGLERKIKQLFNRPKIDYITFTSSSTADHFFSSLPGKKKLQAKLISIGPVTSETIRRHGFPVYRQACVHTIDGLVNTILKEKK